MDTVLYLGQLILFQDWTCKEIKIEEYVQSLEEILVIQGTSLLLSLFNPRCQGNGSSPTFLVSYLPHSLYPVESSIFNASSILSFLMLQYSYLIHPHFSRFHAFVSCFHFLHRFRQSLFSHSHYSSEPTLLLLIIHFNTISLLDSQTILVLFLSPIPSYGRIDYTYRNNSLR